MLTGLGADGLPVEVVVPDLASIVELRRGAAIVEGLHNDLQRQAPTEMVMLPPCSHGMHEAAGIE